jgi:hypothetical protein
MDIFDALLNLEEQAIEKGKKDGEAAGLAYVLHLLSENQEKSSSVFAIPFSIIPNSSV